MGHEEMGFGLELELARFFGLILERVYAESSFARSGSHGDGVADASCEEFAAQLGVDLNSDGSWDFFDVQVYITAFGQGCP